MKLTDRKKSLLGAEASDLIHIVKTGDTSQNSAGSSYKIEMGDYKTLFSFTGGTVTGATNFTNGLSATTISATTYLNLPTDVRITGGTYDAGTAVFTNNTGGTFNVSGFKTSDLVVTGGTYNAGTATFTNNTGGTFNVSGFATGDTYISGMTFNQSNYDLSINRNDGVNFTQNLGILASDMNITGGTYNPTTGVATFNNNSGGTFNVTGFLTGMTDTIVTGGTYNPSTGIAIFTNSVGGTFSVSGFSVEDNYQKIITTSYVLTNIDNNYTILINNGSNPITITVPNGLLDKFQVGFIQQGTGDVTFITSGTTILTPIAGGFKIKGQNYNAYLEQVGVSNVLHLLGNLKV